MGGFVSVNQEDVKVFLQNQYITTDYPNLIHKQSRQHITVRHIISENIVQADRIISDVNLYKQIKCQSISKIIGNISLQSTKICSQQQSHYILQAGFMRVTLKQEFTGRKYFRERFTDKQIFSILKTYCCGLKVYDSKFKRNFNGILSLQSLRIDQQTFQLRLNDLLFSSDEGNFSKILINKKQKKHNHHNNLHLAPEQFNSKQDTFNQSSSLIINPHLVDLYKVGIIILELLRMQKFNSQQRPNILFNQINSVQNNDLRKAIQILLSNRPENRLMIFTVLNIQQQKTNNLQKLLFKVNQKQSNSFQTATFNFGQANNNNIKDNNRNNISINSNINTINNNTNNKNNNNNNKNGNNMQCNIIPPLILLKQANSSQKTPLNSSSSSLNSIPSVFGFDKYNITFKKIESNNNNKLYFATNQENSLLSKNGTFSNLSTERTMNTGNKTEVKFTNSSVINLNIIKDEQKTGVKFNNILQNNNKIYINNLGNNANVHLIKPENSTNISNNSSTSIINNNSQTNTLINKKIQSSSSLYQHQNPVSAGYQVKHQQSDYQKNQYSNKDTPIRQNKSQPSTHKIPNKQVLQILKKLGIGSLLYYKQNQQSINQQKLSNQIKQFCHSNNQINSKLLNKQNNHCKHQQISNKIKQQQNLQQQTQQQQQRKKAKRKQLTPLRHTIKKYKYNSTIVEVGNQDSQQFSQQSNQNKYSNPQQFQIASREYVIEQYHTGSTYEGYKLNGKRDGFGKFYYQDGGFYEGDWKNNKMNGQGKLYYQGGKLAYKGSWKDDQFHGYGKVYNDSPGVLEEGFDFSNFDYLQDCWQFYEGKLQNDTKQGRGKILLTNGQIFEGDFQNDRIQGFGKFFMLNGLIIQGIWKDSKLIKVISS